MSNEQELQDQPARKLISQALDSNIFVDAGAGSGKTKAMVDRVCALIDSGIDISQIVAITFTEKAAAELRQRIRTQLSKLETSPERSRALDNLDAAPIGTIHSFAGRLLRENPIEAGVPPLLTISDELGSQIAFTARWEKARDYLFTHPQARSAIDVLLTLGVTLTNIEKVAQAFDYSWDRLEGTPIPEAPSDLNCEEILQAVRAMTALRTRCAKPEDDSLIRTLNGLELWANNFEKTMRRVDAHEIPSRSLFEELLTLKLPKLADGNKTNWKTELDYVRSVIAESVEIIQSVKAQQASSSVAMVIGVLSAVVLEAARNRQESGNLEFHDLLVHSRALVASSEETWKRISSRYPIIMLDEFQDTDPLQAELAVRLAATHFVPDNGDWRNVPLRNGALFTVGDPKQSIYRFRNADIATFLSMASRFDEKVKLTTNFRSSAEVLNWVNTTFAELIKADGTKQPEFTALSSRPGRPSWNKEFGPAITVIGRDCVADTAKAAQLAEAHDLAHLIREAVGLTPGLEAWQHEKFDEKTKTWSTHKLRLEDICILIPSRTSLHSIQTALDEADIEYIAEASSLVYSSEEIRNLLLTAKAISNTADQAALVAALRSPVFGCGDDELLLWVSNRGVSDYKPVGNPWNLFGDNLSEAPTNKVAQSLAFIQQLVNELPTLTPAELLQRIVVERELLEQELDTPRRSREAWRRIRYIVDQAEAWHENTHGSLRDYLRWAELQQDEKARVKEAVVPETGVDAVRIMTIHASKGLEFPMVIVAGASGNSGGTPDPVLFSEDGKLQVRLLAETSAKKTFPAETEGYAQTAKSEASFLMAEMSRLLYVACTRAETHLVVSEHRYKSTKLPALASQLSSVEATTQVRSYSAAESPTVEHRKPAVVEAPVLEQSDEQWEELQTLWSANSSSPASYSITSLAKHPEDAPVANPFIGEGSLVFVPEPFAAEKPRKKGPVFRDEDDIESEVEDENLAEERFDDAGHVVGTSSRSGLGARTGTAVHKTIELSGLILDDSLDEYAQMAASAAEVNDWKHVAELASSALNTDIIREAATSEHWLELPMTKAEGATVLEGVADLVYRNPEGNIVIVDFKTDHALTEEKLSGYWAQLSAYANMIHQATGEKVTQLTLIQCSQTPARVLSAHLSESN